MIESITVTTFLGDTLTMVLARPYETGLAITSIDGLGPVKADINTTELSTTDGAVFNSARLQPRNIVLELVFQEILGKESIEDIRQKTYKYFPLKKTVELYIKTDNLYVKTIGYVESNEPNIFSKKEGTQVSIICPDPFFYSAGKDGVHVTEFASIKPRFKFPFSNPHIIDPKLLMGTVAIKTEGNVYYKGNSEIGMTIHIAAVEEASNITITSKRTGKTMVINTDRISEIAGGPFGRGDEIIIRTMKNNKSVVLLRNGKTYNILNCLGRHTNWFYLYKGDNIFYFTAEKGITNLRFRIENLEIFEGI